MKYVIFYFILFFAKSSYAGRERDGDWPSSIALFNKAKSHLIKLIEESSTAEVQKAINNMQDREEHYKPQNITVDDLKFFVNSFVEVNEVELEKSTYDGVKQLDYDNSNPLKPKLWATRNFFNNKTYQVPANKVTVVDIKEVQKKILHEISHLWGFGEDDPAHNFADIFSTRMIRILHSEETVLVSDKGFWKLLNEVFYRNTHATHPLLSSNEFFKNKKFQCLKFKDETVTSINDVEVNLASDSTNGITLLGENLYFRTNGYSNVKDSKVLLLKFLFTNGFIIEESLDSFFSFESSEDMFSKTWSFENSKYFVKSYITCFQNLEVGRLFLQNTAGTYFSKKSIYFSNIDDIPTDSFILKISRYINDIKSKNEMVLTYQSNIQEKIISNIENKIMKVHKEQYLKLINAKGKYTSDEDNRILDMMNSLLNSDTGSIISQKNVAASIYIKNLKEIDNIIHNMKNIKRQQFVNELFFELVNKLNKLQDGYSDLDNFNDSIPVENCYKLKRIGDFNRCQIENRLVEAKYRIMILKNLRTDVELFATEALTKIHDYFD